MREGWGEVLQESGFFFDDKTLKGFGPQSLALITTYACTARCNACCYGCTPERTERLSLDQLIAAISEARTAFPSIRSIVFTGGEPMLLGDDLYEALRFAADLGAITRMVTNGYWARSTERAQEVVDCLFEAGLSELNISTGGDHRQWVPVDHAINGVLAAARAGLTTVLTAEEERDGTRVMDSLVNDPRINAFQRSHPNRHLLRVMRNVWVDFTPCDTERCHVAPNRLTLRTAELTGCTSLFNAIALQPEGHWLSCCGLTNHRIPELVLGELGAISVRNEYIRHLNDFMKIWLFVEGPERILRFIEKPEEGIDFASHPCEVCHHIFTNDKLHERIREAWNAKLDEVLFKFMFIWCRSGAVSGARRPGFPRAVTGDRP